MQKSDKIFIFIIIIVLISAISFFISFSAHVYLENKYIDKSHYELLEIKDYNLAGSDRKMKVVRIMQIDKEGITVHEVKCYTNFGVDQVIGRLIK